MVLQIDALRSREYLAVLVAIKAVPSEVRKQIRQQTKAVGQSEWQQLLREHAATRLEHRVIADTAVVSASDQNIRLQSAGKGKALSGGLQPKVDYPAVEFGANRNKVTTYTARSRKGRSYRVTRHINAQLRWRNRKGSVFYPAGAAMIPRIASLWAQTTVRVIGEAFDGKKGS